MTTPRFFLGVGAQRAGTTWLAHYLRALPDVGFSPLKEICFFDGVYVPGRARALVSRSQTKDAALGIGRYGTRKPLRAIRLGLDYLGIRRGDPKSYRAYLERLGRGKRISGEISPSYAALPREAIVEIERLLDRPRYLFLMRNPADRLFSQLGFRRARPEISTVRIPDDDRAAALALIEKTPYSNYADCLDRYLAVVDQGRFHVAFTESLFDPATADAECRAICDHLGVGFAPVPLDRKVNAAPPPDVDPALRDEVVRRLAPEYRAAEARFGQRLPGSWVRDIDRVL